jgi:hypothetical protein
MSKRKISGQGCIGVNYEKATCQWGRFRRLELFPLCHVQISEDLMSLEILTADTGSGAIRQPRMDKFCNDSGPRDLKTQWDADQEYSIPKQRRKNSQETTSPPVLKTKQEVV